MSIVKKLQDKILNNYNIFNDLERLNVDFLKKEESDVLLAALIYKAYQCNNKDLTVKIIDFFEEKRISVDPLPIIIDMFLNKHFNVEMWKWVILCFPMKESTGYFLDLVNSTNDIAAVKISGILIKLFPNITNDEWDQLLGLTEDCDDVEYHNPLLREFFKSQVIKTGNFAKVPNWLIQECCNKSTKSIENDEHHSKSTKDSKCCNKWTKSRDLPIYPLNIPSVKEAVDLIFEDLEKLKINLITDHLGSEDDEAESEINSEICKNMLISQYAISTSTEKILMLANVKHIENFDDSSIFQEYGPMNSNYSLYPDEDLEHQCVKYGGCRLLLCNEYNDTVENGEKIDFTAEDIVVADWFTGVCDECDKRIKHKHYALRRPLVHGGWKGIYCSFVCLEKSAADPIIAVMMGRIKEQYYTLGIRDR